MAQTGNYEVTAHRRARVGISSCLLGAALRYDGGHKRDAYINEVLSHHFEFVPVCPEVAIGMGIPREPIRLVRQGNELRVQGVHDPALDVTEALRRLGRRMAEELKDIAGYIFKRASPSCGMEGVTIFAREGRPVDRGSGMYAWAFMQGQPLLPVEEEGRLKDPALRENFLERVLTYSRWQDLLNDGLTLHGLAAFHSDHQSLILAHDQAAYRRLGELVARAGGKRPMAALADQYLTELMTALRRRVKRKQDISAPPRNELLLRDS